MATNQVLEQIVGVLAQRAEGARAGQLARELRLHPEAVARALARAQHRGVLLQEDAQGRIQLTKPVA